MIADYSRSQIFSLKAATERHITSNRQLRVKDLPKVPTWHQGKHQQLGYSIIVCSSVYVYILYDVPFTPSFQSHSLGCGKLACGISDFFHLAPYLSGLVCHMKLSKHKVPFADAKQYIAAFTPCLKKLCKIFLSELRQIYINFNNFW